MKGFGEVMMMLDNSLMNTNARRMAPFHDEGVPAGDGAMVDVPTTNHPSCIMAPTKLGYGVNTKKRKATTDDDCNSFSQAQFAPATKRFNA